MRRCWAETRLTRSTTAESLMSRRGIFDCGGFTRPCCIYISSPSSSSSPLALFTSLIFKTSLSHTTNFQGASQLMAPPLFSSFLHSFLSPPFPLYSTGSSHHTLTCLPTIFSPPHPPLLFSFLRFPASFFPIIPPFSPNFYFLLILKTFCFLCLTSNLPSFLSSQAFPFLLFLLNFRL